MLERLPIDEHSNGEVAYVEFITTGVGEDDFWIAIRLAGFHISSNRGLWNSVSLTANADSERPDEAGEHDGDGDDENDADDR